jgi:predicted phage tail protein
MAQAMRTIRLYGKLGTKYGRVHSFCVSSVRDAISAMCVMFPGFEREMLNSGDQGISYAVFAGKRNLREDQLSHPVGGFDIRIAPILQGSKQAGLLQTVLGVVLIVVGVVMNVITPGSGVGVMSMGVAMALGGVVQMLSPQPKGLGSKDSPMNAANYNFNGALNVEAQGNPEPLMLGEGFAGSVVISGGIYAEDQA